MVLIGATMMAAIILPVGGWMKKDKNLGNGPMQILEKNICKAEISKDEFEK
ncbi:hypothetical protein ACFSYS_07065 [Christiangramia antarctica]|uniref:Uncharacterized protein n=1 Tax=Christiangramia antarctica TaxID=2058158 RepID=A0ABW5X1T3_9FLAO